jgi:hypothetical protein
VTEQPKATPTAPTDRVASWSSVENELPTYRAVSVWAIVSLLLGVASIFSFAHNSFLAAAVGAIITGAIALRMVQKYPDLVTGKGLANVGIGLGLAFGLSSFTIGFTQSLLLKKEVEKFAAEYAEVVETGSFAKMMFMQLPSDQRAETTPEKFMADLQQNTNGEFEGDPRTQSVKDVLAYLSGPEAGHAHVARVEQVASSGLTPLGFFVVNLETSDPKKEKSSQFLGVQVRSDKVGSKRGWHVDSLIFPYSLGANENIVESAHGHDH